MYFMDFATMTKQRGFQVACKQAIVKREKPVIINSKVFVN